MTDRKDVTLVIMQMQRCAQSASVNASPVHKVAVIDHMSSNNNIAPLKHCICPASTKYLSHHQFADRCTMYDDRQNALMCIMQDWHQKLHNNTTPDDVIICEAYIKFLEGNGDNGSYWAHLNDNGITRQRLESFDRAIKACSLLSTFDSARMHVANLDDYAPAE